MKSKEELYDLRTLERNFERGKISQDEYEAYLSELEDVEENAAVIEAEFVEGVLEDDEEEGEEGEED